jgi:SAM-dependent methyltransferase
VFDVLDPKFLTKMQKGEEVDAAARRWIGAKINDGRSSGTIIGYFPEEGTDQAEFVAHVDGRHYGVVLQEFQDFLSTTEKEFQDFLSTRLGNTAMRLPNAPGEKAMLDGLPKEILEILVKTETGRMKTVRDDFKRLKRKLNSNNAAPYCIPLDPAITVDRAIVGTFNFVGFCQRRPTFFEFCKASGSDKVGYTQSNPFLLDANHYSKHNYESFYPLLLEQLRGKPVKVLELGLHRGSSLFFWKAYFGPTATYVGVDAKHPLWYQWSEETSMKQPKEPTSEVYAAYEKVYDFKFVSGQQQDSATMDKALKLAGGSFDVIIDDGAHNNDVNRECFKYLFPFLKPGGVYIVEDLNTAYSKEQNGGKGNAHSWVEKTKGMLDTLNRADFDLDFQVDGLQGDLRFPTVDKLVASVHCQREICAYVRQHPDKGKY